MDNVGAQELDRIVAEMQKVSGGLRNYGDLVAKARAEAKLERDLAARKFNDRLKGAGEAATGVTTSFHSAMTYFSGAFLGGGIIAVALTGLGRMMGDVTRTYQELAAHGQTFGGSLLEMQIAAAQAGLPLEEFAKVTKENSLIVAQMGRKEWPQFQRELRASMVEHGNFGMSMGMLTEFTTKQLDTWRRAGVVEKGNNKQRAQNMTELAGVTANLTEATGKARDEIATLANQALQSSRALSRIQMLPEHMRSQALHEMQVVTSIMASQAGRAGDFMANAFAEAAGTGGFAQFSTQGQTLINAGMGHLVTTMNELSRMPTAEGAVEAINAFKGEIGRNLPVLQNLALSTGESGAAAREMLSVYEDLRKMSVEDIKRKATEQNGITKFFNTIETVWNQIVGGFKEGFLKGFEPFFKSVGDINNSQTMKRFGELFKTFGEKLGGFIATILSEDNLKSVGEGLSALVQFISDVPWKHLFSVMGAFAEGLAHAIGFIVNVSGQLVETLANWPNLFKAIGVALGGFLGGLLIFKGFKALKDMFSDTDMTVNANNVIINGGDGGGGGGGGGNGYDPDYKRHRGGRGYSRQERLDNIRRSGYGNRRGLGGGRGRMGGALKGVGKFASFGKTAARSMLKKVPGLGLLAGVGFGIQRLAKGDFLGAAMEVGSGVAGSFPGLGTAASIGLDMALAGRDSSKMPDMPNPDTETARPSKGRFGKAAMAAGGAAMAGGVAAYALGAFDPAEAAAATVQDEAKVEEKPKETDPQLAEILSVLKKLLDAEHEGHDLMMNIGRAQSNLGNTMNRDLRELIRKASN